MAIKPLKVADGLWRGPEPILIEDKIALRNLGIKYVLDLETGSKGLIDGEILQEAITLQTYGIRVFNHPLSEITPPTARQLTQALSVITTHEPIYVHCKAGVDRTGMVIAHYRMMVGGLSRKDAIAEMKALGMHVWYWWWAWFLP